MKSYRSFVLLLCVTGAGYAQSPVQSTCRDGESRGTRIDYEASIPSAAVAMGPWSEVQRNFPEAKGVTARTVFVTRDLLVDIQRGIGLKATVSKNPAVPAPGVHFRAPSGEEITFIGYEQAPLHTMTIHTATERVTYNSILGEARRSAITDRDPELASALAALDASAAHLIGEREYAGVRCTAKRIPMQGPRTETCVKDIDGWPVALYLQYDLPEAGGLQWYRATQVRQGACVSRHELSVPSGVPIVERRRRS